MIQRPVLFRILTLVYLLAVAILCFANFNNVQETTTYIFGIPADKIVHFLMFLPFPVLAIFSFRLSKPGVVKTLLILVGLFILGCLIAYGTEYIQSKLPYRSMDMADFQADRIGLAVGAVVAFLAKLFSKRKADA